MGIGEDAKIVAGDDGRDEAVGWIEARALGEARQHGQQQKHADAGEHRVDGAPAASGEQRRSRRRREHGHDHGGNRHIGKPGARGLALEQIANDGQCDGHARAGAGALDHAPCQQRGERPGKRAADAGDDEQRAGEHHDGLAAVAVGSRPVEQRREGEAEHEQAHHQAGLRRRDVKRGGNRRQRRQAHVDAEGRQGDEKTQQQGKSHRGGRNTHGSDVLWLGRRYLVVATRMAGRPLRFGFETAPERLRL